MGFGANDREESADEWENGAMKLSLLFGFFGTFFRLFFRSVWPPKPYPRPPGPKRWLVILFVFPLFGLIQLVHWLALLLDEVLFPGYRNVSVERPIFVIGIPRSGTTFLHRVLAQESERFSTFSLWELLFAPAICERWVLLGLGRLDRRVGSPFRKIIMWTAARLTGGLESVHRLSLEEPEEDFLVLMPIFACYILLVMFPFAPEIQQLAFFDQRVPPARRRRVMAFYRAMVQRHLFVRGKSRIFLSKNVSFTPMVESLLETFPDARLVVCARSPLETIPSQISAMEPSWRLFGNPVTRELFIDRWLELMDYYYFHLGEVLPTLERGQRICFEMKSLRAELEKCVRSLYVEFDESISPRYARILQHEARSAQAYHSRHDYSLEKYGLRESELEERYGESWRLLESLCAFKADYETNL
jgi:hypothetical protein